MTSIKIENDDGGPMATIVCFDPAFAQHHLVLGHKWVMDTHDTDQLPYVVLPDTPDLLKRLKDEGWYVDTSDYEPPGETP